MYFSMYTIYILIISIILCNYEYLSKIKYDKIYNTNSNCTLCWNLHKNMHYYSEKDYLGYNYYDEQKNIFYINDNKEVFTCISNLINDKNICDYTFNYTFYDIIKNDDYSGENLYDYQTINCTICTNYNITSSKFDLNNLNCISKEYSLQHCFYTILNMRKYNG